MFTGIVACQGRVRSSAQLAEGIRLAFEAPFPALELGESVSVSGVCLTVAALADGGFEADLSTETLERTTLGKLVVGARVNLERALSASDRLGGHLVTGHVDAVVRVRSVVPEGEARRIELECPGDLARLVAAKGSVALDGVSLTVNTVADHGFSVMLIPHTLSMTTLGELGPGSALNLEIDLFMRYVARWLETQRAALA